MEQLRIKTPEAHNTLNKQMANLINRISLLTKKMAYNPEFAEICKSELHQIELELLKLKLEYQLKAKNKQN